MDSNEKYMLRALDLARLGAGRVSPNPMVGAVIVKGNEIIGEGYHHVYGQDHAEVDALKYCRRLGNDPAGATMFVTLEPCCHHGKTPPCTDAIIAAGIAAVEIATIDDFPQVAGHGVEILKAAGITVNVGLCGNLARSLNDGFFKRIKTGRPSVLLKWAQSIDGKITFRQGDSRRWFTGDAARHDVHLQRNMCDAILVGSGTCLADDPMLNVRLPDISNSHLKRVVLDTDLSLPLDRKLFNSPDAGPVYIMTSAKAVSCNSAKVESLESQGCEIIAVAENSFGQTDLGQVLDELGRLGVCNLMAEGGSAVLNSLIEGRYADKAMVYISPLLVGEGAGVVSAGFVSSFNLTNVNTEIIEDDIRITGVISY
ncbi:MAG: bifunctional diaminohydroxyphosphoribosylaminopyrimidine deaminase/5-amino-6-(5-phosphoribosylamino)uracil reductase RibD [Sedimentisphaerales bacterium]|nr:bifunctional diaminohydroxyphosphoribosylaminopyrimidine deaminase/5-amino-6-(5-phosphoribosylamino)uracil reductase RibD [Sedimentisphaerales bacterium]